MVKNLVDFVIKILKSEETYRYLYSDKCGIILIAVRLSAIRLKGNKLCTLDGTRKYLVCERLAVVTVINLIHLFITISICCWRLFIIQYFTINDFDWWHFPRNLFIMQRKERWCLFFYLALPIELCSNTSPKTFKYFRDNPTAWILLISLIVLHQPEY